MLFMIFLFLLKLGILMEGNLFKLLFWIENLNIVKNIWRLDIIVIWVFKEGIMIMDIMIMVIIGIEIGIGIRERG